MTITLQDIAAFTGLLSIGESVQIIANVEPEKFAIDVNIF